MKKNEVKLWLDYHRSVFPDWTYSAASPEAKAIAYASYAKALASIELNDAKEATDRMLSGNIKKPFRNEDHLSSIIQGCKQISSENYAQSHRSIDGQETVGCKFCYDMGVVMCWRRNLIDQIAVRCSCAAARGMGWMGEYRYDPMRCYRVGDDSQHWQDVLSGVASVKPANHESAFDAFSTTQNKEN